MKQHSPLVRLCARARALLAIVVGATWFAACNDRPTRAGPLAPDFRADSAKAHLQLLRELGFGGTASLADPGDPDSVTLLSVNPALARRDYQWQPTVRLGWFDSWSEVVGTFSGTVDSLFVRPFGTAGVVLCSGTFGELIGYDSLGNEIARTDLELVDPSDCSPPQLPDDVSYGAQGTLVVPRIKSFKITIMNPLEFQQSDGQGGFFTNHAYTEYMVRWRSQRPPCPPNEDPLANDKAFRDSLSVEYDRALAEFRERFIWLYKNFATGEYATRYNLGTGRDQCGVYGHGSVPPVVDGFIALAGAHTHIVPYNQPVGIGCVGIPMTALAGNGPSPDDSMFVKNKSRMRHYIIDDNELFAMETDAETKTYAWTKANGCR